MKAVRLEAGEMHIRDEPAPVPRDRQALVRITASGVCHSDLHIARADWFGIGGVGSLGHEAIGVVEALGPGADRFVAVGDRVILGLGGAGGDSWCGACEYCIGGQPRHCDQAGAIMGTFAEQMCVGAQSLVKLPDSIADSEAPLACGGLTAYGAVRKLFKHQVNPGRAVAVIGAAGGLGHYAVQIASAFGYRVVGVDIGEDRLQFVRDLGAELAVGPDEAIEVVQREYGGVDAVLVFSARISGFNLGMELLRKAGLFVAVGLPATSEGNFELNPFLFFMKDPTIIYSAVGTVQEMRELVDLAAAGKVKTHVGRRGPMSELPAIFDDLEHARYLGRAVITDMAN